MTKQMQTELTTTMALVIKNEDISYEDIIKFLNKKSTKNSVDIAIKMLDLFNGQEVKND